MPSFGARCAAIAAPAVVAMAGGTRLPMAAAAATAAGDTTPRRLQLLRCGGARAPALAVGAAATAPATVAVFVGRVGARVGTVFAVPVSVACAATSSARLSSMPR
jgi:hypothetical protein